MDPRQPLAEAIAIAGDRIAWVGPERELGSLTSRGIRVIDCEGMTLLPGFIDCHCHVLAYASSLMAVDCSPSVATSMAEIGLALRQRAANCPEGAWIRGAGYDESSLREGRHPNRWDLDQAVTSHPVRLNHRSGHACVLNSTALARVGISLNTPDPPAGVIDRDPRTGEPTGLLVDMDDYLEGRIPTLSQVDMDAGARLANERLVSLGITSVQDANHTNSPDRWRVFKRLQETRALAPRVTMMAGASRLQEFLDVDMGPGFGDLNLNIGAAKVMLTTSSGHLQPPPEELADLVGRAERAGFQVAIHAVEADAVAAAVDALSAASPVAPPGHRRRRHRIEHCSECPDETLDALRDAGALVVTQPAFIYYNGDRYLAEVPLDAQPSLYRMGSLRRAGVTVAAGSDAPVAEPNPLAGMSAAARRRTREGKSMGEAERVSSREALKMYTTAAAYAALQEADKGSVGVGKLADLILLDGDPTAIAADGLGDIKAKLTMIGGRVAWEA